jgi:AraC-like DNA-binding protein
VSERLMGVLLEATAVSNYFEFRSLLGGELPPYDLYLSIHRPDHADRYRQLASARVHFEDVQPGLTMSVDSALLERPVVMADPRAMAAAEARCRRMLGDVSNRRNWSDWCEMMLRDAEDCQPSLDRLASFVNVSARTLARYLEAEGVSFRALSLGVRIARARQLLAETDAPVTQIALRLGYSEVASFVRSFRRETGESPTEFRMRCGATVSAP